MIETKGRSSFLSDEVFKLLMMAIALLVVVIMGGIFFVLFEQSLPAIKKFGVAFFFADSWNPVTQEFGALSSIYGTLVSTIIALVFAVPLSIGIALFLVEMVPPWFSRIVATAIDLLAAIPSIIYGMWGLFVFAPFMADHVQPWLGENLGFIPLFQGPPMGIGMLTAGIILAFMVLPFISAMIRSVFEMVPGVMKESAYGIGSTTWEVTRHMTIPYGVQGILGACFLGLGRALGETMAITFVIGNNHSISTSLFEAGNSIASTLANEFSEASDTVYLSALMELGLVLGLITFIVQIISQIWLKKISRSTGGK